MSTENMESNILYKKYTFEKRSHEILDYRNVNGNGWKFFKYDGILKRVDPDTTPEEQIRTIQKVQSFELRDDDVMIVAYPKCGTHWLWEIVHMIRSGQTEYHSEKKEVAMLEMSMTQKVDDLPSPRILNSHNYFRHLPNQQILKKKVKIIHVMRNPKDVSVSYFHHFHGLKPPSGFEGNYSEFADLFMDGKASWGSYFEYIKDWQQVKRNHPDLLLLNIFYEDLKKKPKETIRSVAEFLNCPLSDELCSQIGEACSFTKLRRIDKEAKSDLGEEFKSIWKKDHIGMYRKGEIGDWKNWLTVAQNEVFDDLIDKEMADIGIRFVFE